VAGDKGAWRGRKADGEVAWCGARRGVEGKQSGGGREPVPVVVCSARARSSGWRKR
jgi:hypothetical protein